MITTAAPATTSTAALITTPAGSSGAASRAVRRGSRRRSRRVVGATIALAALLGSTSTVALDAAYAPSAQAATIDSLTTNGTLAPGDVLRSPSGGVYLTMQSDGNAVIYKTTSASQRVAVWHSNTPNNPGAYLVNQDDGNLVIYRNTSPGQRVALWASGSKDAAKLVMQDDDNLVLYRNSDGKATWSTKTGVISNAPANPGGYRYILPAGVGVSSLGARHHDYPAVDIPVTNQPYYAVTGGTVQYTAAGNGCGTGIILNGDDGVQYTYCHGSSRSVSNGARVGAGQRLGTTGNTGTSSGPHLHFQLRSGGVLRCPQTFVTAIARGTTVPDPRTLPTTGCF
jgi:murein DD-endopeptidase MepM/ murein hydrolase activator NlpD